jgi:hypothetical protein
MLSSWRSLFSSGVRSVFGRLYQSERASLAVVHVSEVQVKNNENLLLHDVAQSNYDKYLS